MKRFALYILLICFSPLSSAELSVLTYHDVVADPSKDQYAVSRSMLVAHLDYLQEHGYRVLSLSELNTIYQLRKDIPKKSVMLTFDDGLKSYYEFVVPLLKIYGYPSVASVVTAWVDGVNTPREYQHKIMNWAQLREISKSKLVDVITHSNNLHNGIISNPQGNEAAAAVTRKYFADSNDYESEKFFRQRIHLDLNRSIKRITKELKKTPTAITWPYGEYDSVISREAKLLGLDIQFTLDKGPTTKEVLPKVNRIMLVNSRSIDDFDNEMRYNFRKPNAFNAVRLRLDDFADLSASGQEKLLSELLDAIESADINTVIINPFYAKQNSAFFYNKQINVNVDILNRITHQLKHRLAVNNIYIDVPKIKSKKLDKFQLYKNLSRLNWFNGVLVGINDYKKIMDVMGDMRDFRPNLKFGIRNNEKPAKGIRFAMFSERLTGNKKSLSELALRINNMSVETYLLVNLDSSKAKATSAMLRRMKELGVKRLGVSSGVKSFIQYNKKLLAIKTTIKANTIIGFRSY